MASLNVPTWSALVKVASKGQVASKVQILDDDGNLRAAKLTSKGIAGQLSGEGAIAAHLDCEVSTLTPEEIDGHRCPLQGPGANFAPHFWPESEVVSEYLADVARKVKARNAEDKTAPPAAEPPVNRLPDPAAKPNGKAPGNLQSAK